MVYVPYQHEGLRSNIDSACLFARGSECLHSRSQKVIFSCKLWTSTIHEPIFTHSQVHIGSLSTTLGGLSISVMHT